VPNLLQLTIQPVNPQPANPPTFQRQATKKTRNLPSKTGVSIKLPQPLQPFVHSAYVSAVRCQIKFYVSMLQMKWGKEKEVALYKYVGGAPQ